MDSKSNQEVVASVKAELIKAIPTEAIKDISLPTQAAQGTAIVWESSQPEIISNDGIVTRPPFGSENADVKLTATITLGDAKETLSVMVHVLAEEEGRLTAYYDFNDGFADRSGNQADAIVTGDRIHNTGGKLRLQRVLQGMLLNLTENLDLNWQMV